MYLRRNKIPLMPQLNDVASQKSDTINLRALHIWLHENFTFFLSSPKKIHYFAACSPTEQQKYLLDGVRADIHCNAMHFDRFAEHLHELSIKVILYNIHKAITITFRKWCMEENRSLLIRKCNTIYIHRRRQSGPEAICTTRRIDFLCCCCFK